MDYIFYPNVAVLQCRYADCIWHIIVTSRWGVLEVFKYSIIFKTADPVRHWVSTRCLSVLIAFRVKIQSCVTNHHYCLTNFTFPSVVLILVPFFLLHYSVTMFDHNMITKRKLENNTSVHTRLTWRKSKGRKAGKTVGKRAIAKRWGQESQKVLIWQREREGWRERENGEGGGV